jgi:2-keto-3-deoxy-L-rhamnonate aldolase RhmA/quercetin dioxygenase-like cupin family protein
VRTFLDRLYFSPLGNRPGGPANASGYLSRFDEMVARANDMMLGGVSISTAAGVERVDEILAAKDAGLRLLLVDRASIARSMGVSESGPEVQAALEKVEAAARRAEVPLGATAASREEARNLHSLGYRHVIIGSDLDAMAWAHDRFSDIPRDAAREPAQLRDRIGAPEPSINLINGWLKEGKVVHLGFLMSADKSMALDMAERTNALWIDAEHGAFTVEQVRDIMQSLPPQAQVVVRVGGYNHPDIIPMLDAGAKGVVAPNVNSAEEAGAFVRTVKGHRPDATAVVMIETRRGVENADVIVHVPGVDAVHLGPYDLSLSLGAPMGSPEHNAAVARVEEAVRSAGVPLGGVALLRSRSYARHDAGYQFLTTVSDQEATLAYFRRALAPGTDEARVRVVRAGEEDPLRRYVTTTVLPEQDAPWQVRPDGTRVRLFHAGDELTVQVVSKDGTAVVGTSFDHAHREGQITIVERGRSRMEIDGVQIDLGAGDIVYIPSGVRHRFTDMSEDIRVIDLLLPRRAADPFAAPSSAGR